MTAPTSPLVPPIFYPISGLSHQVKIIPVTFTFSPADCISSYTYSVVASPVATFITHTTTDITINTTSTLDVKAYTITVTALP
jgi:hypothetical protein